MSMRGKYLQDILQTLKQKGYQPETFDERAPKSTKSSRRLDGEAGGAGEAKKKRYTMLFPYFKFDNDLKKDVNPIPVALEAPKEPNDYIQ